MMYDIIDGGLVFLIYMSIIFGALVVGCLVADYVFPKIPFIEHYLDSISRDDDQRKVIRFPRAYTGQLWGVWAMRSETSVFGKSESWVMINGAQLVFFDEQDAIAAADAYNNLIATENLCYMARAV